MIDTDEYERMLKDDDGRNNVLALDLLAEVKRLRETLATIKEDIDGYVSGKGWDGNIEGWQCISGSIAALGIESESEEE